MKKVIKILLWIWQFPQNFAGVIYLLFHTKDKIKTVRIIGKGEKSKNVTFYFVDNPDTSSVCLGEYIFLDKVYDLLVHCIYLLLESFQHFGFCMMNGFIKIGLLIIEMNGI